MKRTNKVMIAVAVLICTTGMHEARADVVVIVSASSTTTTLTAAQIARIFEGKSNSMTPVDIVEPSVTRREFYAKVVGKDAAQVKARWSKLLFTGKAAAPKELPSGAEVVKAVAADPNAIGYVDRSFVNMMVKVIYTVK
jgi:ABC-type phosphate transport system substrate-binding protein